MQLGIRRNFSGKLLPPGLKLVESEVVIEPITKQPSAGMIADVANNNPDDPDYDQVIDFNTVSPDDIEDDDDEVDGILKRRGNEPEGINDPDLDSTIKSIMIADPSAPVTANPSGGMIEHTIKYKGKFLDESTNIAVDKEGEAKISAPSRQKAEEMFVSSMKKLYVRA